MVAVSRRAKTITPATRLTVLRAKVLDCASICAPAEGANAVISCIGPPNNLSTGTIVSQGATNIVGACHHVGISRFVMQAASHSAREPNVRLRIAWRSAFCVKSSRSDEAIAEQVLRPGDLDWVIVRPVGLRKAAQSLKYTAGPNARIPPLLPLSFAERADCLIRAASEPMWIRKIINVGR